MLQRLFFAHGLFAKSATAKKNGTNKPLNKNTILSFNFGTTHNETYRCVNHSFRR